MVRIRGRVRTVRIVRAPDGTMVAAFRMRRRGRSRDAGTPQLSPTGQPMQRWIEEVSACGAFLLDDGTGVALVDDDAVDVEALDVAPLPSASDGTLALRDGDLAEVLGPATWGSPPTDMVDARLPGDKPLLRFDGRPDARLLVLPLPLTAMLPIARFKSILPSRPGSPPTREHEALAEMEAQGRAEAETRGAALAADVARSSGRRSPAPRGDDATAPAARRLSARARTKRANRGGRQAASTRSVVGRSRLLRARPRSSRLPRD